MTTDDRCSSPPPASLGRIPSPGGRDVLGLRVDSAAHDHDPVHGLGHERPRSDLPPARVLDLLRRPADLFGGRTERFPRGGWVGRDGSGLGLPGRVELVGESWRHLYRVIDVS